MPPWRYAARGNRRGGAVGYDTKESRKTGVAMTPTRNAEQEEFEDDPCTV